jgi:hypothetical protein
MSTTTEAEVSEQLAKFAKLLPWLRVLIVGAFFLGGWAAVLEYRQRSMEAHNVHTVALVEGQQKKLESLSLWQASTEASRFNANQANELTRALTDAITVNSVRVQRLEDQNAFIKETLMRIEKSVAK